MSSALPVYVGVDGSAAAVEAADLAAGEALARGAYLVLLHVTASPSGESPSHAMDSAVARVRLRYPTVAFATRHVAATAEPDGPAGALAAHAANGGLLVVGHRRPSGRRNPPSGSVAQRLVEIATVPTIVYRPIDLSCDVPEPRRVLAGVGPHGAPDSVLDFALSEAMLRHAALDVICALPDLQADEQQHVDPATADRVQRWLDKYPDVNGHFHVRHGIDPAIALMVESHTAQLVVVGSGPSHGPASSISHALVHRGACPVAVVPAP